MNNETEIIIVVGTLIVLFIIGMMSKADVPNQITPQQAEYHAGDVYPDDIWAQTGR